MNRTFLHNKLEKMYSEYWPMEPSEEFTFFGKTFADYLLPYFIDKYDNDFHIAMGYYSMDLKPDIGYLNSFSTRNTLFFNVYLTEFITDYMVYLEHKDDTAFSYFFCKQMRNMEFNLKNRVAAAFFNRLYQNARGQLGDGALKFLLKASGISTFVAVHELSHQSKSIINSIKTEYIRIKERENTSNSIPSARIPNLDSKEMTEVACDFIALSLFDRRNLEEGFKISKEDMVGISASIIVLINLYRCFPQLTLNAINNGSPQLTKLLDNMNKEFSRRSTGLMALIASAQREGTFFQKCDLFKTVEIIQATGELLDRITRFFVDQQKQLTEEFQNLTREEKERFYLAKPDKVWFYYL